MRSAALLLAMLCAPHAHSQTQVAAATPVAAAAAAPAASAASATSLPRVVIVQASDPTQAAGVQLRELDDSRRHFLLPKLGASAYEFDRDAIESLPQGADTPIDKMLLRAPGVSSDSEVSNPDFHVRNEYANVQYRLNGIQLPDGVSGFGSVLESRFIGRMELLDGVLPAQYGLRTAGVVDIATPSQIAPGGSASLLAGSHGTLSPALAYGGTTDQTQYFGTLRGLSNEVGIENPGPAHSALHDHTSQGKGFGYLSRLLGDGQRLTVIGGAMVGRFQIPDLPGQVPLGDYGDPHANSATLDENERDSYAFGMAALQTKGDGFDTQLSAYVRYAQVRFLPDVAGDLAFNDVASTVLRQSLLTGMQFDGALRVSPRHTLRSGFGVSAEHTVVDNDSRVLPLSHSGQILPTPLDIDDRDSRVGWNIGAYLQDEWRLDEALTLASGLRVDLLDQFVKAHQFSPRLALIYQLGGTTRAHLGFARYFTPPIQADATPTRIGLFANTTQQPLISAKAPARPERSSYLDAGIEDTGSNGVTLGVDVYYKRTTDMLDDGQFGQAAVLTQLNYAHAFSRGIELKAALSRGGLRVYLNASVNQTMAKSLVSNQYLFDDPAEFAYVNSHYFYTDDDQFISASTGVAYRSAFALLSLDGLFGSGLRSGFANQQHAPAYTQWNIGAARDIDLSHSDRPLNVRLSVVNLFDRVYQLRTGSGIGVFAPQYGPRRSLFLTLSYAL